MFVAASSIRFVPVHEQKTEMFVPSELLLGVKFGECQKTETIINPNTYMGQI
jgi:hypothetical protein